MKPILYLLALLSFLAGTSAWADIPPPDNASAAERAEWEAARRRNMELRRGIIPVQPPALPQSSSVPLAIICSGDVEKTRVVISRKLMKDLQEKIAPSRAQLPSAGHPTFWPTVIAGLALSFALVLAGLLLVRSRRRLAYGGLGFLAITLCFLGISCKLLERNAGDDSPSTRQYTPEGKLKDKALVELSDTEDGVKVYANGHWVGQMIPQSGLRLEP
jgi:hypothetical protein